MPMSREDVATQLIQLQLLTREQLDEALRQLPADVDPSAAEPLLKLLVRQERLTKFQAQHVLAGKGTQLILGNYVLLDKIGQGGMGLVLKAMHRRMGRIGALKMLPTELVRDSTAVQRFQREVQAAARLSHPNIVTAYDADESNGVHFFVMEYVEGLDLSTLVKRSGPFGVELAIDCMVQAAKGLAYAHSHGVIHRDIKPANLLLDGTGTVKILDMGLARIESEATAAGSDLTTTGTVMGTVDYMSPEQALNTKHANEYSDQYSLGVTLHFLLTGRTPYPGETVMEKLLSHREAPIPSLCDARTDVPLSLDGVFRRMLAKRPQDRFKSMADCITALDDVRGELSEATKVLRGAAADDGQLHAFLTGLNTGGASFTSEAASPPGDGGSAPTIISSPTSDTAPKSLLAVGSSPSVTRPASGLHRPVKHSARSQAVVWGGALAVVCLVIGLATLLPRDESIPVPIKPPAVAPKQLPPSTPSTPAFQPGTVEEELAWVFKQHGAVYTGIYGSMTPIASLEEWKASRDPVTVIHFNRRSQVADEDLRRLQAFPALHSVTLTDCPVTDKGLSILVSGRQMQSLDLRGTQVTDDGLRYLSHLHSLASLSLSSTRVTGSGLKQLVRLRQLQVLDLSYLKIDDQAIRVATSLPMLVELQLIGCDELTDACGESIVKSTVSSLRIDQTQLTDAFFKTLAAKSDLRNLWMSGSKCSAGGFVSLAQSVPLLVLDCSGTSFSPEEADALRNALPDAQIMSSAMIPPALGDLLSRIDVRTDSVAGDWRKSGVLLTPVPNPSRADVLKLPVARPYRDYQLNLAVNRLHAERRGGLALVLPIEDRHVLLHLDSIAPAGYGVEMIRGKGIGENGTLLQDKLAEIPPLQPIAMQITIQRYPSGWTALTVNCHGRVTCNVDLDSLDVSLPALPGLEHWSGWGLLSWDEFAITGMSIVSLPEIYAPAIDGRLVTQPWPDAEPIDIPTAELLASDEWEWSLPENIGARVNDTASQDAPTISSDGLELLLQEWSTVPRVVHHRRESRDAPWRPGVTVKIDEQRGLHWPKLGPADDRLFAPQINPGGVSNGNRLMQARRDSPLADWTDWQPVFPDAGEEAFTYGPGVMTADGLTLYFGHNGPGGPGEEDLWVSHRETVESAWGKPQPLPEPINSVRADFPTDISTDGQVLLLTSRRDGGVGGLDYWYSVWNSAAETWGEPQHLDGPMNTPADDWAADLAADGRTLLFGNGSLQGFGGGDLWITRRVPRAGTPAADKYPQYRMAQPVFTFNGRGEHIEVADWSYNPNRAVTIECWCTPTADGPEPQNLLTWLGPQWIAVWRASGRWGVATAGPHGTRVLQAAAATPAGVRCHLAAQFDGQDLQLFVDGQPQQLSEIPTEFPAGTTGLYIGGIPARRLPHTGPRNFVGTVDALWIVDGQSYREAFTPREQPLSYIGCLAGYRADAVVGDRIQDVSNGIRSGRWRPAD